jgi:hypothetical protein
MPFYIAFPFLIIISDEKMVRRYTIKEIADFISPGLV